MNHAQGRDARGGGGAPELSLAVDLLDSLADRVLGLSAHLLKLGTHGRVGGAGLAQRVGGCIDGLRVRGSESQGRSPRTGERCNKACNKA